MGMIKVGEIVSFLLYENLNPISWLLQYGKTMFLNVGGGYGKKHELMNEMKKCIACELI